MIAEHESVFGGNPLQVADKLRTKPSLLNQLPYTTAVIKETMRMYTPAGAFRAGSSNVHLRDKKGRMYPTEGCLISLVHHAIHYNPRVWPRVHEFIPERWLVEPGHELYPQVGAFRTFEQGQRSCIGINLAYIELRTVLAMTVRLFRVSPAYEEWDELRPRGLLERVGLKAREKGTVNGDRAYQVDKGGAHPKDGYPCKVTML